MRPRPDTQAVAEQLSDMLGALAIATVTIAVLWLPALIPAVMAG